MLLLSLLIACDEDAASEDVPDATADSGEAGEAVVAGPEYSGGTCPVFTAGTNTDFVVGEDKRDFELLLPADPTGAPVVFVWHWLGGSASDAVRYMELDTLSDAGAIVIAPESAGSAFEWLFTASPEGNADLQLFDDLLACIWQQHQVDLDRVYATGMSAGGLWTSYLTLYRSASLAATAPLSGGADASAYSTPDTPIPVMLTWGGENDTYGSYSFDDASQNLSASLQADGHFVIECVHSGGHTIPSGAIDYIWRFFEDHPAGIESPYLTTGLPDALPEWCSIP